jgi:epoxyqueuosine reductase
MKQRIIAKAREIGFDAVGVAPTEMGAREQARLDAFIALGQHGDMEWMERTAERRRDPRALWPEAKSVIALATNYGPDHDPMDNLRARDRANISVYARNRDYHDLVKKRLKQLGRWMASEFGCELKVFVDTAPVLEKPLAHAAGLGWQGKHSNLVSRDLGSWFFLGEIFTTLDLEPNQPEGDHCGSCSRCLDVCPTNAFPAPYTLDATRCISYLTIEHKGHIDEEFRVAIGNRIYGCDDCLAVCPWNKFAKGSREAAFVPRKDLDLPLLTSFLGFDDAGFRARFSGSPVKRIGRDRFLRNVLIAIGNAGDAAALAAVERLLADTSPLVRAMAVWAARSLASSERWSGLRMTHQPRETDEAVIVEWSRAGREA